MEAVRILLDSADYYYGITCSVWACFEDSEGEFKRLPQNNCSAFYGKDSYMNHQIYSLTMVGQLQELLTVVSLCCCFCSER